MNRREFLTISSAAIGSSLYSDKKEDRWRIIQSVQEHLFPKNPPFPSAREIKSARYLKIVSFDSSFDKDDLRFIFDGVDEVVRRGWRSDLKKDKKESILQEFSQTSFGQNWISTLLNYTFEALLSDPIYGGNVGQKGYKSLNHKPGVPTPVVRFGKLL